MCRWYDTEGVSSDLAATGGGKKQLIMILQALLALKSPILFPQQNTRESV